MELHAYLGPLIAIIITSGLILWLSPLAKTAGLVDTPSARKIHKGEVPLIGGLSIFVAVFAAIVVSGFVFPGQEQPASFAAFYLAAMLLVLVGTVDDFVDLSPLKKVTAQVIATLIMIYGARVVLNDLGMLGVDGALLPLGFFAVPFTVFATVGVINALNMSDGLDGLAGSLVLVSLVGFIAASILFGNGADLGLLAILAAAVTCFLLFNYRFPGRPGALVYLGDSGSMFLGFALAWFAIRFSQGESSVISPSTALWFLMVPLIDAVCIMTRRLLKRRPPFGADREHLHHIFLLAGFTVTETVAILAGIALVGVGAGLVGAYFQAPDYLMLSSFVALGLAYLWVIMHSWSVMRFLRRSINRRTTRADRRLNGDRRRNSNVAHMGPERRSGIDRRKDLRRSEDDQDVAIPETSTNRSVASS